MYLRLACLLLVLLPWAPVLANADDLVVRAGFSPGEAWVGQRVVLQLEVLAADAWAQLDGMPRIEVPGAYVLPPQDQGVRLQETLDGRSHTGQRYEFFVYPQRAGTLALPAATIAVRVRQFGAEAGEETLSAALPASSFESRMPPGAEDIEGLISTTELRVEQRWEPAGGVAQVGDALRRSLRFAATGFSGMAFPPIEHAPLEGFGVYPAEPQVDDRFDRGSLRGTRTESVTYVAERPGKFELPAIRFTWWDTGKEQLQQVELPGMSVAVSGTAAAGAPGGLDGLSRSWSWWWLPATAAVPVMVMVLSRLWRTAAKARAQSEQHQFRVLQAAIRRGHAAPAMRELMRWLDRINDASRPARLDRFLERYGDADTRALLRALQQELDGSGRIADGGALAKSLAQARERWLQQVAQNHTGPLALPPLNGTSTRET